MVISGRITFNDGDYISWSFVAVRRGEIGKFWPAITIDVDNGGEVPRLTVAFPNGRRKSIELRTGNSAAFTNDYGHLEVRVEYAPPEVEGYEVSTWWIPTEAVSLGCVGSEEDSQE